MGRPPLVDREQILTAARELARERGCSGVAISEIAQRLGRPTGSVYHRFHGRDHLLAELWLDAVEQFQVGFIAALSAPDGPAAARAAARHVLRWTRAEPERAFVLQSFRRSDLLGDAWPPEVVERAEAAGKRLERAIRALARTAKVSPRRARTAVVDVPYAVVRRALDQGVWPSGEDEELVDEVVVALMASGRR